MIKIIVKAWVVYFFATQCTTAAPVLIILVFLQKDQIHAVWSELSNLSYPDGKESAQPILFCNLGVLGKYVF